MEFIGILVLGILVGLWLSRRDSNEPPRSSLPQGEAREAIMEPSEPQGGPYSLGETITTNVAGVSFEGRQATVAKLMVGDKVILVRNHENPHDANAIEVRAFRYKGPERQQLSQALVGMDGKFSEETISKLNETLSVGYINREVAARIADSFDSFVFGPVPPVQAVVVALTGRDRPGQTHGVRIQFQVPTQADLDAAMGEYAATMWLPF